MVLMKVSHICAGWILAGKIVLIGKRGALPVEKRLEKQCEVQRRTLVERLSSFHQYNQQKCAVPV